MHIVLFVLAALLATLVPAHATVGFACYAEDKAAVIAVNGAYGTSLGGGMASFGGDIEIRLKAVPTELRKRHLDRSHVSQHWFVGRDLKILTRWDAAEGEPFGEVVLIVETHRGKAEESSYRGRYALRVHLAPKTPGGEMRILKAGGTVVCGAD